MFNKAQFFMGVAVSAIIGIGIGYSKAREIFLEAMIKAMPAKNEENKAEQTDD